VAGASCGIFPEQENVDRFRIWVDFKYANYLWHELETIVQEIGGTAVAELAKVQMPPVSV
jgi:hypothetical protein